MEAQQQAQSEYTIHSQYLAYKPYKLPVLRWVQYLFYGSVAAWFQTKKRDIFRLWLVTWEVRVSPTVVLEFKNSFPGSVKINIFFFEPQNTSIINGVLRHTQTIVEIKPLRCIFVLKPAASWVCIVHSIISNKCLFEVHPVWEIVEMR